MGGAAVERRLQPVGGRRGDDDLADRRRLVEDVAVGRDAARRRRTPSRPPARAPRATVNSSSSADRRALDARAPARSQQHGDRRLVVGAEDRVARALPPAVDEHRLDAAPSGTVSRCAHSRTERSARPGRARAGCPPPPSSAAPSSSTSMPSAPSSPVTRAATARSSPERARDRAELGERARSAGRRSTSEAGRSAPRPRAAGRLGLGAARPRRPPARAAGVLAARRRRTRGTAAPAARDAT